MVNPVHNALIYEVLRRIQSDLASLKSDMSEANAELRGVRSDMTGFMQT